MTRLLVNVYVNQDYGEPSANMYVQLVNMDQIVNLIVNVKMVEYVIQLMGHVLVGRVGLDLLVKLLDFWLN